MTKMNLLEIIPDKAPLEIENKEDYFLVTIRKSDLSRLTNMLQALEIESKEQSLRLPYLTSTGRLEKEIVLTLMKEQ